MEFFLGEPAELSPEDRAKREQFNARVSRDADPKILARITRWEEHKMVPLSPSLPAAIRPQATHFDKLSDWYAGYLSVRGEQELPHALREDLKQSVPQAILRDFFRPAKEAFVELGRHDLDIDPGGRKAWAEARAAQKREPLPTVEPVLLVVVAVQRRRHRMHNIPWLPFRPDEAPRKYTEQDLRYNETEDDDGL